MQGSLGAAICIWQAVKSYKGAAANGDTTAMVALGKFAEYGQASPALPRDAVEALR